MRVDDVARNGRGTCMADTARHVRMPFNPDKEGSKCVSTWGMVTHPHSPNFRPSNFLSQFSSFPRRTAAAALFSFT